MYYPGPNGRFLGEASQATIPNTTIEAPPQMAYPAFLTNVFFCKSAFSLLILVEFSDPVSFARNTFIPSFFGNIGFWILSPRAETQTTDITRKCLEGRNHSVMN